MTLPATTTYFTDYATTLCIPRYSFTGKERDTESGNDYFMARYYSSAMGRFMSPDWSAKATPVPYARLDNPQSLNLYGGWRTLSFSRLDQPTKVGCPILSTVLSWKGWQPRISACRLFPTSDHF
ncbi:MAG: RHS repeat-associated core domain-containing protein [Terracidiphilus sp.]